METKVLLVDDERQFVHILSHRLVTRGCRVEVAFSGEEALGILGHEDFDVVVLDVALPEQNGLDILKEIKQTWPLTEVIMLTAHKTVDVAILGMKMGAYDYLMKPTDTSDLVEKINRAKARKSEHNQRIKEAEVDRMVRSRSW